MRKDNLWASILKKDKEFILSTAIGEVENALYTYPKIKGADELTAIREDFGRMKDYWLKGYPDDNRQQIYDRLVARMQRLIGDVERQITLFGNKPENRDVMDKLNVMDRLREPDAMRQKLEHWVTELAMVDLLPANKRDVRRTEVLRAKFEFLEWTYDAILLSPQWSEEEALKMEELFLSPLIDSFSQQALLPAVILGCCIWFDYRKERMLINVYMKSDDVQVKQRALVGLALAMDSLQYRLADSEHENPIDKLLENERSVKELRDLQLQLAMAQLAERDKDVMEKQIIPNIMNNSPIAFKNGAFEELDDDGTEDILDPGAADRRRENLESTVEMMQKLYKSGRDIYYGSFRRMKRYPFFDRTINWTLPYTRLHPSIVGGLDSRIGKILAVSAEHSQLCDCDCYSFLLTLKGTMPQMPEAMIESLSGMSNMPEKDPATVKPAHVRRNLIQNIYRLTHLMPSHTMFPDLFRNVEDAEGIPPFLFFAQPVFADSVLVRKWGVPVAMVLNSREKLGDASMIMKNYDKMEHTFESACFMADMDYAQKERHLEEALAFKQDDEVICRLAQHYLGEYDVETEKWKKGMEMVNGLLEKNPDSIEALKAKGYALLRVEKSWEEAKALLYRVHYETPDDDEVCFSLGELLLSMGNAEQACTMYEKSYVGGKGDTLDRIYYGIGLMACRRFEKALEVLEPVKSREAMSYIDEKKGDLEKCGITPLEIKLFKASLAGEYN